MGVNYLWTLYNYSGRYRSGWDHSCACLFSEEKLLCIIIEKVAVSSGMWLRFVFMLLLLLVPWKLYFYFSYTVHMENRTWKTAHTQEIYSEIHYLFFFFWDTVTILFCVDWVSTSPLVVVASKWIFCIQHDRLLTIMSYSSNNNVYLHNVLVPYTSRLLHWFMGQVPFSMNNI